MQDIKLPDGTWVTTAMSVGVGMLPVQCENDACAWEDTGPPVSPDPTKEGEVGVPVQLQRCSRCGWVRGRYLGNPHPESDDTAVANDDGT